MYRDRTRAGLGAAQSNRIARLIVFLLLVWLVVGWLFPNFQPITRVVSLFSRPKSYAELALKNAREGNQVVAWQYYTLAIEQDPQNPQRWYERAFATHFWLNWSEDPLADVEQAIRLKPDYAEAYFLKAMILHESDEQQSEATLDRAIEIKPDYVDALLYRAENYDEAQESEKAIEAYSRVIAALPEDVEPNLGYRVLGTRAEIYLRAGEVEKAIADFEAGFAYKPQHIGVGGGILGLLRKALAEQEPGQLYDRIEAVLTRFEALLPPGMRDQF